MGHCRVHSQDQELSTYDLIHGWAMLLPSPLTYGTGYLSDLIGTFHVWILNFYCWRWKQNWVWGTSYAVMMLMSLSIFFLTFKYSGRIKMQDSQYYLTSDKQQTAFKCNYIPNIAWVTLTLKVIIWNKT